MPQTIENVTFYNTEDVGKIIGKHPNTVRAMIKSKRINGIEVNGGFLVSHDSITEYLDKISLPHSTIELRLGKISPKTGEEINKEVVEVES